MASRNELIESELLVIQYQQGEPNVIERLISLWEKPVFCYVRHLLGSYDDAKDLTQDVWVSVIRKLHTIREPAAFPAWLFRVARMHVATHFRGMNAWQTLCEDVPVSNAPFANVNDLSFSLNAEELLWGLAQLSPAHRECLILHFLEGFSIKEMAEITNVTVGTIKSRLHYAKKALREILDKENKYAE